MIDSDALMKFLESIQQTDKALLELCRILTERQEITEQRIDQLSRDYITLSNKVHELEKRNSVNGTQTATTTE
jgi:hypothetical protein